ncbi:MAG: acyl carrier protein [Verrucomicrobia subdivision 3 bacterium]|nr:acyl carrier protein [Limisphaerales bacterium]
MERRPRAKHPKSPLELKKFIRDTLAEEMKVPAESLPLDQSLIHLGVDSMAAVGLCNQLETHFSVTLPMAEVLSGKSIDQLADLVLSGPRCS